MKRVVTAALVALACLRGGPAPASNLVVNAGFESINIDSGEPTDWINGGNWFYDNGTFTGTPPYKGSYFAADGCSEWDDISQILPTQAGQTYTLRFAFNPGAYAGPLSPFLNGLFLSIFGPPPDPPYWGELRVFWGGGPFSGGRQILDIAGGPPGKNLDTPGGAPWTIYTVTGLTATGPTRLRFSAYQLWDYNGIDSVSVTPTPLPGSWALFLAGLGLAGLAVGGRLSRPFRSESSADWPADSGDRARSAPT